MDRNMFGPIRVPWPDESWQGWWGEEARLGHGVFLVTDHLRLDVIMGNGMVFPFVDTAPADFLVLAAEAAEGQDVVLGGGPATVRVVLAAGAVDEVFVIAPMWWGSGERLFDATLPWLRSQVGPPSLWYRVAPAELIRSGPSNSRIVSE